ncbi:hypothetical protein Pcinc_013182 [Petrolisthes cinctipes]|uniref:Uncharacterized protein n=1 Tax=Petrolisthes cinctipes TaxID=88211 RepID=A0AAE1KUJ6_PETCI|nr:hypothetical protein Pcinc_013182 [Petrolisthes cinctipes]
MLLVFEMRCLRAILGVTQRNRVRNEKVRRVGNGTDHSGYDSPKPESMVWLCGQNPTGRVVYVSMSYRGEYAGQHPRGQPRKRWSDQIRQDLGIPLQTAERNILRARAEVLEAGSGGRARGRRRLRY